MTTAFSNTMVRRTVPVALGGSFIRNLAGTATQKVGNFLVDLLANKIRGNGLKKRRVGRPRKATVSRRPKKTTVRKSRGIKLTGGKKKKVGRPRKVGRPKRR